MYLCLSGCGSNRDDQHYTPVAVWEKMWVDLQLTNEVVPTNKESFILPVEMFAIKDQDFLINRNCLIVHFQSS